MERLRNATGKERLGKWVVEEIDAKLRGHGLNHTRLSGSNAWAEVLIYTMASTRSTRRLAASMLRFRP
jgi:hypothetical protein